MLHPARSPGPARLPLASLWLAVLLLAPALVRADDPPEESFRAPGYRALKASAGLGLAAASQQGGQTVSGSGKGFYGDVEYVVRPSSWFSPRFYGGLVLAFPASDCGPRVVPCDVSAQYLFGGAKARVMVPIPWVGPFVELGLGASLGRFSTRSGQAVDRRTNGLAYHVPFAIGLALGERRQFEFSFQYLSHPAQEQFSGAIALGVQFPLD
jgi:hypothetical protein